MKEKNSELVVEQHELIVRSENHHLPFAFTISSAWLAIFLSLLLNIKSISDNVYWLVNDYFDFDFRSQMNAAHSCTTQLISILSMSINK